jgi:hypothetical protein
LNSFHMNLGPINLGCAARILRSLENCAEYRKSSAHFVGD